MPFGATHTPIRKLASVALTSFFQEIQVVGSERVPKDGPLILSCSHSNMAIDPAVLSCTEPFQHKLHYWVKDSLFKNPAVGALLRNAGNIPVDRKNKNNQSLFKGTFEVMAMGDCIGVFPEGTSHTSPHMLPLKDGISWAALEYLAYLHGTADGKQRDGKEVRIVPVGISYMDKSKYRSRIVVEYGHPITMDAYKDEFLSGTEGSAKKAVKRLTKKIELEMLRLTVNTADWDSLQAGKMALELLFEDDSRLPADQYVRVAQTLCDIFTPTNKTGQVADLRQLLCTYSNLLVTSKLTNHVLSDLPLPRALDPSRKTALPTRFSTLWLLIRDTISCLLLLPFFILPMIMHLPLYGMARIGADIVKEELETQAQMKIAFGIIFSFFIYPTMFVALWLLLKFTMIGAAMAAAGVYTFAMYHTSLVDANYDRMKRLLAAWRILVGVWAPKRGDLSIANLRKILPATTAPLGATPSQIAKPTGTTPSSSGDASTQTTDTSGQVDSSSKTERKRKRVPTRRLVRHVLRTRIEAAKALEAYLNYLETASPAVSVPARPWLADASYVPEASVEGDGAERFPMAEREGREVVRFLRQRGARILSLPPQGEDWADAGSGDESDGGALTSKSDVEFEQ